MKKKDVIDIFDEMELDYDEIHDPWYAWLFSRLHYFIARDVIGNHNTDIVLDVGTGTGFQSFLHARTGSDVIGIDISEGLLKVADKKNELERKKTKFIPFPETYPFVVQYNNKINQLIQKKKHSEYKSPTFQFGDIENLNFPNNTFNHVNCCGSVLSFVDDYEKGLSELYRVLKPGGTLFIEVESRYNIEIFWMFVDFVTQGSLQYDSNWADIKNLIFKSPVKPVKIDYPFGELENSIEMKINLFSKIGIKKNLKNVGFKVQKSYSVHSFTNLFPSTILDSQSPSSFVKRVFPYLAKIEEKIPLNFPSASIAFLLKK